jgi:hypothetical protein
MRSPMSELFFVGTSRICRQCCQYTLRKNEAMIQHECYNIYIYIYTWRKTPFNSMYCERACRIVQGVKTEICVRFYNQENAF